MKTAGHHRIVTRTQLQTSWSEQHVLMRLVILSWIIGKVDFQRNFKVEKSVKARTGKFFDEIVISDFSPKDMMDHMNRENTSTRKNLRLSINRMTVNETDIEDVATEASAVSK